MRIKVWLAAVSVLLFLSACDGDTTYYQTIVQPCDCDSVQTDDGDGCDEHDHDHGGRH